MPTRRIAETAAASVSPEAIWLAATGRMTTSCAAADGERDFAGAWLDVMHALADRNVDETDPRAVRQLFTAEALDELRAEAARRNFVPWAISGREPTGEGFEQWRAEFLTQHDRRT